MLFVPGFLVFAKFASRNVKIREMFLFMCRGQESGRRCGREAAWHRILTNMTLMMTMLTRMNLQTLTLDDNRWE